MNLVNRAGPGHVALETTLLVHGVPRDQALNLARDMAAAVRRGGAEPALVGVVAGRPTVGMTEEELLELLGGGEGRPEARTTGPAPPEAQGGRPRSGPAAKANTSNLGLLIHRGLHAATTVSATMELAAAAGVRVFATGGLGGIHKGWAGSPAGWAGSPDPAGGAEAGGLDISADLAALARFPVAVVCSGVKSMLDVPATREALETLGVPVVGYRTDRFPAFYEREYTPPGGAGSGPESSGGGAGSQRVSPVPGGGAAPPQSPALGRGGGGFPTSPAGEGRGLSVDARFDDPDELASYLAFELGRTGRGVVVANPVPEHAAIDPAQMAAWLAEATARVAPSGGGAPPQSPALGRGGRGLPPSPAGQDRRGVPRATDLAGSAVESVLPPAGRDLTPRILAALHEVSGGATLRANIALALSNAELGGRVCGGMMGR